MGGSFTYPVTTAQSSAAAAGRTYVLPVPAGKVFRCIPPSRFHSEAEIAALPRVQVIGVADLWPSSPDVYAFSRQDVYRNLYQVTLP
jgi:hypothetical protein